ncbi:MAG TPA: hypothetical protein VEJ63_04565 [Planctomycetota bacterium]|nr:hypothetical protein [Planctomycetota bacterium]
MLTRVAVFAAALMGLLCGCGSDSRTGFSGASSGSPGATEPKPANAPRIGGDETRDAERGAHAAGAFPFSRKGAPSDADLGQPLGAPKDAPGLKRFLDGLDALEAERYAEGLAAFNDALKEASENHVYMRARGVAYVLLDQREKAQADFDRAQRLAGRAEGEESVILGGLTWENSVDEITRRQIEESEERGFADHNAHAEMRARVGPRTPEANAAAASRFAQFSKGRPGMAPHLFARAKARIDAGKFAEALRDIQPVRAQNRNNAIILFYWAHCCQNAGEETPLSLRRAFSAVACEYPDFAPAYAGRALAAAKMGANDRARADLKLAEKLDARGTEQIRRLAEKAIVEAPADAAAALAAFEAGVRDDAPPDELLTKALALRRAANATRKFDEDRYQVRFKELWDRCMERPHDGARLAELGEFLVREQAPAVNPVLVSRGMFILFRPFTKVVHKQEPEFTREILENAIAIDPRNSRALAWRGAQLLQDGDAEKADDFVKRALAADPNNADAHLFAAEIHERRATGMHQEALRLRSLPFQELSSDERDGVTENTWRFYDRTQQWEQAKRLEDRGFALADEAVKHLKLAAAAKKGTADEHFYLGLLNRYTREHAQARQQLEKAIELNPRHVPALEALAHVYSLLNMPRESLTASLHAYNELETTAFHLFRLAEAEADRTAWESARRAINEAQKFEPDHTRAWLYRGLIAIEERDYETALKELKGAEALEEAWAKMNNTSFAAGETKKIEPLDAGVMLLTRLKQGEALSKLGRSEDALNAYRLALATAARMNLKPPPDLTSVAARAEVSRKLGKDENPHEREKAYITYNPATYNTRKTLPDTKTGDELLEQALQGLNGALKKARRENEAEKIYRELLKPEIEQPEASISGAKALIGLAYVELLMEAGRAEEAAKLNSRLANLPSEERGKQVKYERQISDSREREEVDDRPRSHEEMLEEVQREIDRALKEEREREVPTRGERRRRINR